MANNTLAFGFVGLEKLFAEQLTDQNVRVVRDAIFKTTEEHNRQVGSLISEMVQPTTEYKVRFRLPSGGSMQPLDEWGNPLPVMEEGYYDIAFPIFGAGTAWGDNRISRAHTTVQDINERTLAALRRDGTWLRRQIMSTLLTKSGYSFDDDIHGTLAVKTLANGDSVTYLDRQGNLATANHYVAQAAAIGDAANPFPTIYNTLTKYMANAGAEIVSYVPTNVLTEIEDLTDFYAVTDPLLTQGISDTRLERATAVGLGDELIGRVNRVWIVEWKQLPDDYILSVARNASMPTLMMRQYEPSELQGLFTEDHSPDGNLQEFRFLRYCGFGAYNRVGAMATFVEAGDTTYDNPANFTAPVAA